VSQSLSTRELTISYIARRLDVTRLAISHWLQVSTHPTVTRRPLPAAAYKVGSSHRYVIRENDLLSWLSEYRPDLVQRWKLT
jgi:transcriptional regulator with XRE-family HTH domain